MRRWRVLSGLQTAPNRRSDKAFTPHPTNHAGSQLRKHPTCSIDGVIDIFHAVRHGHKARFKR
ncbi:Uncharacterised protein [Shigella sonnei]|uniref:E. coli fhuB gene involved in transport of ferrichrome n=1 Tax=Escherichia coli TaxID=562 RepID=Q47216_ECOLX|nr:unnamed protein product [Escherichia coli]CSS53784.1 Uncharacterised protein [Shigella sonnei]